MREPSALINRLRGWARLIGTHGGEFGPDWTTLYTAADALGALPYRELAVERHRINRGDRWLLLAGLGALPARGDA